MTSLLCAVTLLLTGAADRDAQFEARLQRELADRHPGLERVFAEATAAADADRHEAAVEGFTRVTQDAPEFAPGHRRLGWALLRLNRVDDALSAVEKAYALSSDASTSLALGMTLLSRGKAEDKPRAREVVARAMAAETKGSEDWARLKYLECRMLLDADRAQARSCGDQFLAAVPENPVANYFAIENAAVQGDWDVARARLEKGRSAMAPGEYDRIKGLLDQEEPITHRWGMPFLKVLGGWFALFGVMAVLGLILSAITLSTARKLATQRSTHTSSGAHFLRTIYRAVIAVGSVFYYVSLPIVILSVVVVGGGLIYAFFALGRVPIKLVAVIAVLVLVTLGALLRSLFVRISDEDPGERLEWDKAPRLRQLVDDVAAKVGTRTVDTVYLTPGTDLAVFERGGFLRKLNGKGERCLILGIGVLEGFKARPFRSVLAHEFGHFSNKDTAGGGLALVARNSLVKMGMALAQGGAAAWYNPAWLFFRGFLAVFLRMSQGASRLQEVLADRLAIFTYGSAAFAAGYSHVIRQSVRFDAMTQASIREVINDRKALSNLYRFRPSTPPTHEDLDQAYEEEINREPSPYDSHPCSRDRLNWAQTLNIVVPESSDDGLEVWSLFNHREALEHRMTAVVRNNVAENHSIVIDSEQAGSPANS